LRTKFFEIVAILGEEAMKKFINYLALMVFLGLAGVARADQPFIRISTTPKTLDLGEFFRPGEHQSSAVLKVKVESNGLHGPILVSVTKLKSKRGYVIEPEQILVKSPVTSGYVPMKSSVIISKSKVGSHNIELNFKVMTEPDDRVGSYEGMLIFTIVPPI
jgi:hypothetical protein